MRAGSAAETASTCSVSMPIFILCFEFLISAACYCESRDTTRPSSKTVAFETAYAVFDAQTGNLLMSGTLQAAKQTAGQPR